MMILALDNTTLPHLAVHARGLLRLRVSTPATPVALHLTLSGEPLAVQSAEVDGDHVFAIDVTPAVAGYHLLAGELRAGKTTYRIVPIHLRVAGDAVNIVHIDQSNARVVDNSRSTFGAPLAGVLGDGDWRALELDAVAAIPTPAPVALPQADFVVTTPITTYRVTEALARGDLATIYGAGNSVLKIADQASDNDLLQHEARVLGLLTAIADKPTIHFAPPREQFRTADGRLGTAFPRLDGLDLTAIRDIYRARGEPGLPARHVVWILRRALAALGWAHKQGILHGNVTPAHLLVRGRDHMLWLVDWCWAVVDPAHTGQTFKALDETYSPPEVAARGAPTPASDLYALGKCAIHVLGGDPATKTLPELDPRLARFIRYLCLESQGGRGQDAWELYLQLDKIREQIWGAHTFVPLDLARTNNERN